MNKNKRIEFGVAPDGSVVDDQLLQVLGKSREDLGGEVKWYCIEVVQPLTYKHHREVERRISRLDQATGLAIRDESLLLGAMLDVIVISHDLPWVVDDMPIPVGLYLRQVLLDEMYPNGLANPDSFFGRLLNGSSK